MKKLFKMMIVPMLVVCLCAMLTACGIFGSSSDSSYGSSGSSSSSSSGSGSSSSGSGGSSTPKEDSDGTFIYSGSSIMAANTSISGAIVIPSTHNGNTIDTIPANAFKGCNSITSITVPDSVTSIGSGAFSGCSLLKSITLPVVGSQKGNSGEKAANFGYIFGTDSYQGGTSVKQYYDNSSTHWYYYYIPSTLRSVTITNETVLSYGAFQNCSMLTTINLSDKILQVGIKSFSECSKIEEINLPSISILPASLFEGCLSLRKFTINPSVDTIGGSAFSGCSALSSINSDTEGTFIIPNAVTSIGSGAFNGCPMAKSITLPFVGTKKGNSGESAANFGYIFGTDSYQGGTSVKQYYDNSSTHWHYYYIPSILRSVTITNETVISYGAFQNCNMLKSITINSAAQSSVGSGAFENTAVPTWN